jgi:hypothetical protein
MDQGQKFVFDFDHQEPLSRRGGAGARGGSQRVRPAADSPRLTQSVFADERLRGRLSPTVSDLPELHGMQKVRGSNPLSSTIFRISIQWKSIKLLVLDHDLTCVNAQSHAAGLHAEGPGLRTKSFLLFIGLA